VAEGVLEAPPAEVMGAPLEPGLAEPRAAQPCSISVRV
jgi:hypothetical protein